MPTTIAYATHTAHLDSMTGSGLLVMPRVDQDVSDPLGGVATLHEVSWGQVIRDLDARGWEPFADDYGLPTTEGTTSDGRQVLALYGRDPIMSEPSLGELLEARRELHALAGVVAGQARQA